METLDQRVKELVEEARKANREDLSRIELFEGLQRHPGWAAYVELLNARIQTLADSVLAPSGSVDGAIALEYVKGTMSGVIIARDLTSIIIAAKDQIHPLDQEEVEDQNESLD